MQMNDSARGRHRLRPLVLQIICDILNNIIGVGYILRRQDGATSNNRGDIMTKKKVWQFGLGPPGVVLQEEFKIESVQKRAARFVRGNCSYETGSTTGILGQLTWESLKKKRKTIDLLCYIKVLKVKSVYQQITLSPKLGIVEISTLWHFRLPLLIQMFIKVAFSPDFQG